MKRSYRLAIACLPALLVLPSCTPPADDQGHSHGGSSHSHAAAGPSDVAITRWAERTELFMEYPAFVAGQGGRAAIHLTDLTDFSPLDAGQAIVTLRSAEGRVLEFRGGLSTPGIFGVYLLADRPGVYEMTLRVEAPGFEDEHDLGQVTVHPAGDAPPAADAADEGTIAFLKEQQWTLEFGTSDAEERALQSSITVPALVQPRAGGEALLSAPVPGRIDPSTPVPIPGTRVEAGAVLARIVPRPEDLRDAAGLRAALVEAEEQHGLASRASERVERLVASRALPARRLDEAKAGLAASTARLDAARQRWSRFEALSQSSDVAPAAGAFTLRAPFDGTVSSVRFSPGASVDEGEVLVRVIDTDRVHIIGAVPESKSRRLRDVEGGEVLFDDGTLIALPETLSVGRVVEPVARTMEVRFAFDNRQARIPVGRNVNLRLFLGDRVSGVAVPESAIVDDGGRPVVFVQSSGEAFERRPVQLGGRAGGWIHVVGVEPGERIVHRGAYLIRLASLSPDVAAHGHVH